MIEDAYPLSHAQLGMLFHSERERQKSVYHDISVHSVRQPLDSDVLQAVIDDMVRAHAVLRTRFKLNKVSRPLQIVERSVNLPVETVDLTTMSVEAQKRTQQSWVTAEQARGFDLNNAPLMRVRASKLSDEQFTLALSFHHAILDGWSVSQLVSGIVKAYMQRLSGESGSIEAAKSLYRDYIALEYQSADSAASQELWKNLLEGASFTGLPRWNVKGETGIERCAVTIPAAAGAALRSIAATAGTPVKTVLLAA
ncbi:MAG TPA: condensation domain-containing protein, partial [Steroidobacteraceae bacterium]|nr:condensation domain-containing protein [Steroidobacteraceae bacterium]